MSSGVLDYTNLPQFIDSDMDTILDAWNDRFMQLTNRPLLPMQTEAIILNVMAYREKLLRDDFNAGGRSMLLDFSTAPMLDFLVALLGVERLAPQFASVVLEFNIVTGHTGVTIPSGTSVQSTDGKVVFGTTVTTYVPPGTYVVDIPATCTTAGVIGNSYAIGTISTLLDSLVFVTTVASTIVTAGGADQESDDQLSARAKDAADRFSNAGSKGAYKFWAKTASPAIVDVAVMGPEDDDTINPGEVHIFPLVINGGTTPTPILDSVFAACNPDTVRPLNDLVVVASPTAVDYDIDVDLTIYTWAKDTDAIALVTPLLQAYAAALKAGLSLNAIKAKIEALCMQNPVYNVAVNQPAADTTLSLNEYANIGTITVNVIGTHA